MSCKELFDLFQKSGGEIMCNYKDKKCLYFPEIFNTINVRRCDINSDSAKDIDNLINTFYEDPNKNINYMKIFGNNNQQEILHSKQKKSTLGFYIEYYKDPITGILTCPSHSYGNSNN